MSGVHFNFFSKLALKSRLWTHHSSVCRVKTQTKQKVRLDLKSWSVICNPWCVHNRLFQVNFQENFKFDTVKFVSNQNYISQLVNQDRKDENTKYKMLFNKKKVKSLKRSKFYEVFNFLVTFGPCFFVIIKFRTENFRLALQMEQNNHFITYLIKKLIVLFVLIITAITLLSR
jgi:hypothetical protein